MIIDTIRFDPGNLAADYGLSSCLACGKCTSSCPFIGDLGDIGRGRSPRGIVERALTDPDILSQELIWFCPTCDVCTERCPAGIRLRDLISELRRAALLLGHDTHCTPCTECGRPFFPADAHDSIVRRLEADADLASVLSTCPSCRRRASARHIREAVSGPSQGDAEKPAS